MNFSHHYVCRTCDRRVECDPEDPKRDPVVLVLIDPKKNIYEFDCTHCAHGAEVRALADDAGDVPETAPKVDRSAA